jgi:hypothetical protein
VSFGGRGRIGVVWGSEDESVSFGGARTKRCHSRITGSRRRGNGGRVIKHADARICAVAGGCGFAQIYCRCSVATARQRNSSRAAPQQVPDDVIERMAARLEPPGTAFWEADSITVDMDGSYEDGCVLVLCVHHSGFNSRSLADSVRPLQHASTSSGEHCLILHRRAVMMRLRLQLR